MAYDAFKPSADFPGALDFLDSSTGDAVTLPRNDATMRHAMAINGGAGLHPLTDLHPDYPAPPPAPAPSPLYNQPSFDRPGALAMSPGALAEAGDMGDAYGPAGNGQGRAVAPIYSPPAVAPEAPPVARAAPQGPVVMAAPPAASAGAPGPAAGALQPDIERRAQQAAAAYDAAAASYGRGTYVAPSKGGPVETTRTIKGRAAMPGEYREQYVDAVAGARGAELGLASAEGQAAAEAAAAKARAAGGYDALAGAAQTTSERAAEAARARFDAQVHEIQSTVIEPKRLWSNASTGEKIAAGILLGLGALGAWGTGKNAAAEAMNHAIDRDLEAQRTNLATKQGQLGPLQQLYKDALAQGADQQAAIRAMKAGALQQIDLQQQAVANRSGSPVAIARAQKMSADLQAEIAKWLYGEVKDERGEQTSHFKIEKATRGGYAQPTGKELEHSAEALSKGSGVLRAAQTSGVESVKGAAEAQKLARTGAGPTFVMGNTRYAIGEEVTPEIAEKIRLRAEAADRIDTAVKKIDQHAGAAALGDPFAKQQVELNSYLVAAETSKLQSEGVTHLDDVERTRKNLANWSSGAARQDMQEYVKSVRTAITKQNNAKPIGAAD